MDSFIAPFFDALTKRDGRADGAFFYAVKTTGIYCRPSCAARTPRPENVAYYATTQAAETAGYRACKRCRPDQPPRAETEAALVAAACRRIETADTAPDLATLAAEAGSSASKFQKMFKQLIGITPKAYAAAHRASRLRGALRQPGSVTAAIYESGFNAPSRFYEAAPAALGMSAAKFRSGAAGETIAYATAPCSLGTVLAARTATGICAIFLGDDPIALKAQLAATFPKAEFSQAREDFSADLTAIIAAIDGTQEFSLPLDIRGTAFQRRVWQALRDIPAGRTVTYTELAVQIGAPKTAVRAIAAACAANRHAVAIPCHRALRADGTLAGYRWGLSRKRALLGAEESSPD
jgi:AraC family transcriptional regulator of adaptative response/methylated-DNA-[protein]-cysteine methyltransferase